MRFHGHLQDDDSLRIPGVKDKIREKKAPIDDADDKANLLPKRNLNVGVSVKQPSKVNTNEYELTIGQEEKDELSFPVIKEMSN